MNLSEKDLHDRGITRRSVEDLQNEAVRMVGLVVAGLPLEGVGETIPASQFTKDEAEALGRGGLDLSRASEGEALAGTASRYAALLASALTEVEAAGVLGVSESRVRQKIGEGTLYTLRMDGARGLPRFQFSGYGPAGDAMTVNGLVPNIGTVLRELPEDVHPLALESWFMSPNPDLYLGDQSQEEIPFSPRDWLLSGGSPAILVPLAREL